METSDQFEIILSRPESKRVNWKITLRCGESVFTDRLDIFDQSELDRICKAAAERWPALAEPSNQKQLRNELDKRASELADPAIEEADQSQERKPSPPTSAENERIRREAEEMLNLDSDALIERIRADVAALGVAGEQDVVLTVYLTGVSRLLDRPLAVIVKGPSASGKSYVIEKVASLFPPETVLQATQMTPQALFYMPEGSLEHRFVVAGERSRIQGDEAAESTRALREMLSGGHLSKFHTVRTSNGTTQAEGIEQKGPIAFVESTSLMKIFEEDANRCLIIYTDERAAQTKRVLQRTAASVNGKTRVDVQPIIERHHALQRQLPKSEVSIPFSERLAELFPSETVVSRRAFSHHCSMIRSIALLMHRHREIDQSGRIIAAREDYEWARHLLAKPFAVLLAGTLNEPTRRFYDEIHDRLEEPFTIREARMAANRASESSIRGYLNALEDAGLIELVEAGIGRLPKRYHFTVEQPEGEGLVLPTASTLFDENLSLCT